MAPNGIGVEAFWRTLLSGQSGVGLITLFDASRHPCCIAGEVRGFDPLRHLPEGVNPKRLARHTQLALAAARLALQDVGLGAGEKLLDSVDVSLMMGVSSSSFDVIELGKDRMTAHGPDRVPSHSVDASQPHQIASVITRHLPFITRAITVSSACAAGLDAVATAADWLRAGRTTVALTGGADAPVNPLAMAFLAKGGLVSTHPVNNPSTASRPFDRDRDCGVIAEGSGVVVMETLECALARGVRPYLEILGYASHMDTDQRMPGSGLEETMRVALANAGLLPQAIRYISAHGPGHPVMDLVETDAIKRVFGACAAKIPISSIKGVTGNPLSAGGALQLIACCLAARYGIIPPTSNLDHPDEGCDLDYVPRDARRSRMTTMLINSHGLGGGNISMVVRAWAAT